MAMFPANPTRLDPYKNFKFRLKWDGQYVAGGEQDERAQAHHGSGGASQGGDPPLAQISGAQ